jgi:putative flippase GtrA
MRTLINRSGRAGRFVAVGALNTLFGLAIYSLFIRLGSPTWFALVGGNIAGLAFNFVTTGGLVFADLSPTRIPKFVAVYVGTYFVNLFLIHFLSSTMGGAIVSQVILTPVIAVVSYLLMSRVVFAPVAKGSNKPR